MSFQSALRKNILAGVSISFLSVMPGQSMAQGGSVVISGNNEVDQVMTFTVDGPQVCENDAAVNPFSDYIYMLRFRRLDGNGNPLFGGRAEYSIVGHFAADGNAANTHATCGNKWRVYFTPPNEGTWQYSVIFRQGADVGLPLSVGQNFVWAGGTAIAPSGELGTFTVNGTSENFIRRLKKSPTSHYRKRPNGSYFLKTGADSPETVLAYECFDGTSPGKQPLHDNEAHAGDWGINDPLWNTNNPACSDPVQAGRGLIGMVNYLASQSVNSMHIITMNIQGDGDNVWPWINKQNRLNYDVSKLDQWNIFFEHMTRNGLMQTFYLQETENDGLLNNGGLGKERMIYYRELVSRFGHHLAITWNVGEEFSESIPDARESMRFLRFVDAYNNPIKIHNLTQQESVFGGLFQNFTNDTFFDGPDVQHVKADNASGFNDGYNKLVGYRNLPFANKPEVVLDEPANQSNGANGVLPDSVNPTHTHFIRRYLDAITAGSAGMSAYFGYGYSCSDLLCNNQRTRHNFFDFMRRFQFVMTQVELPFDDMEPQEDPGNIVLDSNGLVRVFANPGQDYMIFTHNDSGDLKLDFNGSTGNFRIQWWDPQNANGISSGTTNSVQSTGGIMSIGQPLFSSPIRVAFVRKIGN